MRESLTQNGKQMDSESTTGQTIDPNGVDHPKHYNQHPSGIEVIEVIRHFPGSLFNVFKYASRYKGKDGKKDLDKALWYVEDLIQNPPLLAHMQTTAETRALLEKFIAGEPDIFLVVLYTYVKDYLSGAGPTALIEIRHQLKMLKK